MQRPFASTGVAPLPRYYGLIRLLLSLTLLAVLPSSLAGLSKHAAPFAPPRPRSPNRIGHEVLTSHIETCWSRGFRVNATLRRKFTCVAAYFFVRQDSRTSVALCTACPPNRMSISLRFSSFQLIVHAELRLEYPHQFNNTTRQTFLSPAISVEKIPLCPAMFAQTKTITHATTRIDVLCFILVFSFWVFLEL